MAGIEDLIKTYRGETINLNPFKKRSSSRMNTFGKGRVGKYSTTLADEAANYASRKFPNKILKTLITPLELKIGQKMFHELSPDFTDEGVKTKRIRKQISNFTRDKAGKHYNILSKKNKAKLKIDILKTIASNAKALTPLALKGLSVAASLPAQVVVMTLAPTKVNADEINMQLEDFAKLAEEAQPKKEMMAAGGIAGMLGEPRSGYQGGGYVDYWTMVQESYVDVGGQDGTGMNIQDFAQMYFPRKAEGGRIGLAGGGDPRSLLLSWLIKQGPKAWKWMNKPGNNPIDLYKKYLKSVKDRTLKANKSGKFTDLPLETLAIGGVGGLIANQFKKKMKGMNEDSVIKHDIFGNERKAQGGRIGYAKGNGVTKKFSMEAARLHFLKKIKNIYEKEWLEDWDHTSATKHAQGGRIGLAEGDTPSQAWMRDYFYSSGLDDKGEISVFEFINGPLGWKAYMEHGPGKAKGGRIGYDGGGPINLQALIELYMSEGMTHEEAVAAANKPLPFHILTDDKAEGGRIGFQDGRGIMSRVGDMVDVRNVPYYSGKALQGLVNSAETLSKFPFAAGELGSKLIQQPPKKEMFMKAIEDITPGSWSENVGLTSLIEDMEKTRPEDAKTVGGILGLGTEIAVPTGGAFKGGQLLLSKASKAMGKVKDGKTLEKLVDQKLTDSGQSRRDFMSLVGSSGLMVALKSLGLGSVFKAVPKAGDDIKITLKGDGDWEYMDEMWSGGSWTNYMFEPLTKKGQKILEKLTKGKNPSLVDQGDGVYHPGTMSDPKTGYFIADEGEYAVDAAEAIIKAKGNISLNTSVGSKTKGATKSEYDFTKTYRSKDINKQTILDEVDDYYAHDMGGYSKKMFDDENVEMLIDTITKKAEGGRIGLGAGGPPISGEELKQMKKEASGPGIMDFLKITGSGGMGSNKNIYDQGQQIPGLDQKHYNYGFGVDANIPFDLPKGGMLEIGGGTGFGRGKTETTYKGEPVPGMSGMGESKLGDEWNVDAKITYPIDFNKMLGAYANGGLTKTIPPKRGPMPQGLPSALYNGIMRPRSY